MLQRALQGRQGFVQDGLLRPAFSGYGLFADLSQKIKNFISWEDSMKMWVKKCLISRELGKMILTLIKNPGQWGKSSANWQKFKQLAQGNKNLVFHQSFKEI